MIILIHNGSRTKSRSRQGRESQRDLGGATSYGMDSTTIKHVARLARIRLNEGEEDRFKGELTSVLDYIDQLNKVNTDNVEPLYQTTGLVNSVREDKYRKDFELDENLNSKLVGQAPEKEKRFIRVRSVLKK